MQKLIGANLCPSASPWMDISDSVNKIDLYDVRRRPW